MNWSLTLEVLPVLLDAAVLTVQLTVMSIAIGFCLALPLAIIGADGPPWLSRSVFLYTFIFRGTPLLVQLFLIYYGLGQLPWVRSSIVWPILRDPYWCALLAFSLNHAAYAAEIFRGSIRAVPLGALEAAQAVGMGYLLRTRRIALPTAFRLALSAYGNEVVLMLKASSLASTVTLMELTGTSRKIVSETFAPYEVFLAAASIYLMLTFVFVKVFAFLESRLSLPARSIGKRQTHFSNGVSPDIQEAKS